MPTFYIVPNTLKDSVLILRSLTWLELMSIQGDSWVVIFILPYDDFQIFPSTFPEETGFSNWVVFGIFVKSQVCTDA